jgi:hypothetical protein
MKANVTANQKADLTGFKNLSGLERRGNLQKQKKPNEFNHWAFKYYLLAYKNIRTG